MLTRIVWLEVRLVNGIVEVVEMVYEEGKPAPHLPDFVVLRFDGYTVLKGPIRSYSGIGNAF